MKNLMVKDLPDFLRDAVNLAIKTSDRAVSNYYNYNVCAIIIDSDGECFIGVNWEPANGDSTCGEVGAISSYLLSEKKPIKYVVTFGKPKEKTPRKDNFCTPCGRCRQRLNDFCTKDTIVIGINECGDEVQEFNFGELLPFSFGINNL